MQTHFSIKYLLWFLKSFNPKSYLNRFALLKIKMEVNILGWPMAIAQTQEWPQTANHRQFTRLLARSCSWNTTPFHTMPYHAIPYITHWPTAAALASSRTTYPLPWAFCLNPVTATILSPLLCCNLTAAPQRYKDSSARCFNLWRAWKNVSQDRGRHEPPLRKGISGLFRQFAGYNHQSWYNGEGSVTFGVKIELFPQETNFEMVLRGSGVCDAQLASKFWREKPKFPADSFWNSGSEY